MYTLLVEKDFLAIGFLNQPFQQHIDGMRKKQLQEYRRDVRYSCDTVDVQLQHLLQTQRMMQCHEIM